MNKKLTKAQFDILRNFAYSPYVTEFASWYNAEHKINGSSINTHPTTLRHLLAKGYIKRDITDHHHYLIITPEGITAHDIYAKASDGYLFSGLRDEYTRNYERAIAIEAAAADRAKRDAAAEAKSELARRERATNGCVR